MKPKREHSKVIADAGLIYAAVILIFVMVMIAITKDTSHLTELIVAAGGIATAAMGFYMWRAKAKDKLDMRREYGADIYNDAGIGDE